MKRLRFVIEADVTDEEIQKIVEKYGSLENAVNDHFGELKNESIREMYIEIEDSIKSLLLKK